MQELAERTWQKDARRHHSVALTKVRKTCKPQRRSWVVCGVKYVGKRLASFAAMSGRLLVGHNCLGRAYISSLESFVKGIDHLY